MEDCSVKANEDLQLGWSATSDVALALYPIVVFRNLKVSRKIKVSMFLLLGGGILWAPFFWAWNVSYPLNRDICHHRAGVSSAIKTANIRLIVVSDDATCKLGLLFRPWLASVHDAY